MRHQGKINKWNDEKGFGFISPQGGGPSVFLHINSFTNRQRRPLGNEIITYDLRTDAKGREQAARVAFAGENFPSAIPSERKIFSFVLIFAFLVFVAGAVLIGKLPLMLLGIYVIASVVAFIAYASDKSAAQNNEWRTKENTLHLIALIGGWPGALMAQKLLRHKSKKESFQVVFRITVLINSGVLAWFFTREGAIVLRSIVTGIKELV